jgi:three-Cys-motif partner protein
MKKDGKVRALAFIDPFGMAVDWATLAGCKGLGIDIWILVPTGTAANRLLPRDGKIPEGWLNKLSKFLGLTPEEIRAFFYKEKEQLTLFGTEIVTKKENNSIEKIAELYIMQLSTIWQHVSQAFPMKNSSGSVIYHFIFASNKRTGSKIANDIIGKMAQKD